jgi:flavin-binding protein dodecin
VSRARLAVAVPALVLGTLWGLARTEAGAQEGPATGTWEARWASGVRTERDGSITVQREADATLVLEAAGDSLVGRWSFELPGLGASIWYVHGGAGDGTLRLVATEADIERPPPAAQGAIVLQEWTGRVRGDRVEGEHWLTLRLPDGRERRSGPRPWSARRVGSSAGGTASSHLTGPLHPTRRHVPCHLLAPRYEANSTRRDDVSLAKAIEVLSEGSSLEAAVENAVKEASETVRGIENVYVQDFQAIVDDDEVTKYRTNCKVTFVVGD